MYVPYFTSQDNPKGLSRLKGRGHGLHLLIEGRASKAVEGHKTGKNCAGYLQTIKSVTVPSLYQACPLSGLGLCFLFV